MLIATIVMGAVLQGAPAPQHERSPTSSVALSHQRVFTDVWSLTHMVPPAPRKTADTVLTARGFMDSQLERRGIGPEVNEAGHHEGDTTSVYTSMSALSVVIAIAGYVMLSGHLSLSLSVSIWLQ